MPSAPYPPTLREEEIKNKVATDVFPAFDCTRIFGAVDFCVAAKTPGPTLWETESLLWAEAKTGVRPDLAPLFAQLVLTIGKEKTHERHSPPPFLGAFDSRKIAFLPYHAVVDLFAANDFDWTVAPSDPTTREFNLLLARLRPLLASQAVVFDFADASELAAFVRRNLVPGRDATSRLPVTRNNFVFVYNRWRLAVMPSIAVDWDAAKTQGILDADFFLADLLSKDNSTLVENLYVLLRKNHYQLDRTRDPAGFLAYKTVGFHDAQAAHVAFWNRYKRPPRREFWHWIAERRDLLVPQDVRERKGSYFTPQIWVEKAQDALAAALGEDWQDHYDIWDCAAGTGNLLAGLSNKYKIWASTLDQADVEVMRERISNGANLLDKHIFQFDFLNGSFDALPDGLRAIVQDPERRKKLVVFINPPYAEAATTKTITGTGSNKAGVATEISLNARYKPLVGAAANELFALFLLRVSQELRGCILAQFSKLKHVLAPNYEAFRNVFASQLQHAFLVPANTFDNVSGQFPIGFFVWDTGKREVFKDAVADCYDAKGALISQKLLFPISRDRVINRWLHGFFDPSGEIIGWLCFVPNDFQHNKGVFITSQPSESLIRESRVAAITKTNFWVFAIYLAVRHCMEATWLNDRDQFLWPSDSWQEDEEFQMDCVIYTLFHGQNRISCKAGVNHWIPFTETEVGAQEAFQSHFMTDWLGGRASPRAASESGGAVAGPPPLRQPTLFTATLAAEPPPPPYAPAPAATLTPAAYAVRNAALELWCHYHAQSAALPDASFYDIRAHFQGFKPNGHMNPDSPDPTYTRLLSALRDAQKALAAQIATKVRQHGFLR